MNFLDDLLILKNEIFASKSKKEFFLIKMPESASKKSPSPKMSSFCQWPYSMNDLTTCLWSPVFRKPAGEAIPLLPHGSKINVFTPSP